ncbi:MAG: CDGSH iron-sulfur domain-containing protein [Acidobacteriota bacterium]
MLERFDAIIIGTGEGGKSLAGALAESGWQTAVSRCGGSANEPFCDGSHWRIECRDDRNQAPVACC